MRLSLINGPPSYTNGALQAARNDYSDPGPYKNPPGTVAYEIEAPAAEPARQKGEKNDPGVGKMKGMRGMKMKGT